MGDLIVENYRLCNRMILVSMVIVLVLIASFTMRGEGYCWLKCVYGRECLLCGCTRDLISILSLKGMAQLRNKYSVVLWLCVVAEWAWRLWASFRCVPRKGIRLDMILHSILGLVFMGVNISVMANFQER